MVTHQASPRLVLTWTGTTSRARRTALRCTVSAATRKRAVVKPSVLLDCGGSSLRTGLKELVFRLPTPGVLSSETAVVRNVPS